MRSRVPLFVRLLLLAYPRELRDRERDTLEAAIGHCLARERQRRGRFGTMYASIRLIVDSLGAAVLLRIDEYRRGCLAERLSPRPVPKENLMIRFWQDVTHGARRLRR